MSQRRNWRACLWEHQEGNELNCNMSTTKQHKTGITRHSKMNQNPQHQRLPSRPQTTELPPPIIVNADGALRKTSDFPSCERRRRSTIPAVSMSICWCILLFMALPTGLTQYIDGSFEVEPTPVLRLNDDVNNYVPLQTSELHGVAGGTDAAGSIGFVLSGPGSGGRIRSNLRHELGLVTSTTGTFIQAGVTTEYATQVVGTTLDNGRYYAQIERKSSRVLYDHKNNEVQHPHSFPSIVTSWVGEVASTLLPQSHNDLLNAAEQPDWRDVDDRLRQEVVVVVSNASQLNAPKQPQLLPNTKGAVGGNQSLDAHGSGRAGPWAAQKVLPIADLTTYTVKNFYAPSNYAAAADDEIANLAAGNAGVTNGDANDGVALSRTPKLYYKQLVGASNDQQAESAADAARSMAQPSLPIAGRSRTLATVIYYGFADFTTIVGDSVIIFSPHTAQHALHVGQVTSIKGEATLDGGTKSNVPVSNIVSTITTDITTPTLQKDVVMMTAIPIVFGGDHVADAGSISNEAIQTSQEQQLSTESSEVQQVNTDKPESSTHFTVVDIAESVTLSTVGTSLSRPSDEEIRKIYASLSRVASSEAKQSESVATSQTSTLIASTSVATEGDLQILGGATTVFIEDDPFANFVDPEPMQSVKVSETKTSEVMTSPELLKTNTAITTSTPVAETTTETAVHAVEPTKTEVVDESIASTTLAVPAFTTTVEADSSTTSRGETVSNSDSIVVKESTAGADCSLHTSQVFLTQIPKTLTLTTTLSGVMNTEVVPSFEIAEATKYYCIEVTGMHRNIDTATDVISNGGEINGDDDERQMEKPEVNSMHADDFAIKTESSTSQYITTAEEMTTVGDDHITSITAPVKSSLGDALDGVADDDDDQDQDFVEGEIEESEDEEEDEAGGYEVELIYKTLYTTYTYLTTFFHDDTSSISSHTEVITNVITSTLGPEFEQSSHLAVRAETESEAITNGATSIQSSQVVTPTKTTTAFTVSSDLERIIQNGEAEADDERIMGELKFSTTNLPDEYVMKRDESLIRKTYYTTYTYYTTIFAEGETEIMSRTEVYSNYVNEPVALSTELMTTANDEAPKTAIVTLATDQLSEDEKAMMNFSSPTRIHQPEYSTMIRDSSSISAATVSDVLDDIPLASDGALIKDLASNVPFALTTITLTNGETHIVDNIATSSSSSTSISAQQQKESDGALDDQISSESNTEEILPSATLLLQTSFTTFTYYTTMYGGERETNVISRLETVTNIVTETLQPTKTFRIDEATLPITYFTTFTYWTKLAKGGEISTLSREETISNVVTPSNALEMTATIAATGIKATSIANVETSNVFVGAVENLPKEINAVTTVSVLPEAGESVAVAGNTVLQVTKQSTLEPTTYYTTYTYYTTSYETNKTITDSRYETITNVITPTMAFIEPETQMLSTPAASAEIPVTTPSLELYDYKQIIDADGISTLHFTTRIQLTTDAQGEQSELVSSTSSLYIDEAKKEALQSAVGLSSSDIVTLTTLITATADVSHNSDVEPAITTATRLYKTGLVRLIEGTRIANRTTTLYQSKVIGTIIDNRYAQIIKSTSSFLIEKTSLAPSLSTVVQQSLDNSHIDPSSIEELSATRISSLDEAVIRDPSAGGGNAATIALQGSKQDDAEIETETDDDDDDSDGGVGAGNFPFNSKKRTFTPVIRPFASRNRPQFAPKRKGGALSSATIITRSDFTPTITATPALKSTGARFGGSSRRGGGSSINSTPINASGFAGSASSFSRRFGRPSKPGQALASTNTGNLIGAGGGASNIARNRISSTNNRIAPVSSSSRRVPASFPRPSSASGGFRPGFSSTYGPGSGAIAGGLRPSIRIRPSSALGLSSGIGVASFSTIGSSEGVASVATTADGIGDDISTTENAIAEQQTNDEGDEALAPEQEDANSRRNLNPLLRFRRPLNRPAGFTPAAGPGARPPTAPISTRRNPLTARARTTATTTTSTTTTTVRPRSRILQRPVGVGGVANLQSGRQRSQNSLFPPRGLFQTRANAATVQAEKLAGANDKKDEEDAEYDDEDEETEEDDDDVEDTAGAASSGAAKPPTASADSANSNRRRRSKEHSRRSRRAADTTASTRSNFRNRFRRPKTSSGTTSSSKIGNDEEPIDDEVNPPTTIATTVSRSRLSSRFGGRFPHHGSSTATSSGSTTAMHSTSSNYRAIRPTRPTGSLAGRAQFTLREKDSQNGSSGATSNGSSSKKAKQSDKIALTRSNFRRPQTAATSRRRSTAANHNSGGSSSNQSSNSGSGGNNSQKRRLKSYSSGGDNSARASSVRSRSGGSTGNNGVMGSRNSGNRRHHHSGSRSGRNDFNNDQAPFDGTITVTHLIPAEVTIPVVNGKVTEYRNVITAKMSTEVLGPQAYTALVGGNGQTTLALTRQDSTINFSGATEITQFILRETVTTAVTFTPTTIRGRKTSFSHIIPSTVYSVETLVSTAQPQLAANAPLANILLSQLLLGNIGLPGAANPLLVGATALPGQPAASPNIANGQGLGQIAPTAASPVTEFRTHASTYVTTLFEGMSTVLSVTFQGKKILTTVYDTTAQTITATEFITDTIVTTPTVQPTTLAAQQPAAVQGLLLQQLLLQQQQQQQQQAAVIQQLGESPQQQQLLLPLLNNAGGAAGPAQLLLGSDNLQELDDPSGTGHDNADFFNVRHSGGAAIDYLDNPSNTESSSRKKPRKSAKAQKNKNKQHQQQVEQSETSPSVVTLYVSGRRPGEFSTILSTVYDNQKENYDASTLHKRQVQQPFGPAKTALAMVEPTMLVEELSLMGANDGNVAGVDGAAYDYYLTDGSELSNSYQLLPAGDAEQRVLNRKPAQYFSRPNEQQDNDNAIALNIIELKALSTPDTVDSDASTQTLESIVGDVSLWYNQATLQHQGDVASKTHVKFLSLANVPPAEAITKMSMPQAFFSA